VHQRFGIELDEKKFEAFFEPGKAFGGNRSREEKRVCSHGSPEITGVFPSMCGVFFLKQPAQGNLLQNRVSGAGITGVLIHKPEGIKSFLIYLRTWKGIFGPVVFLCDP
jgi:hypothetical protein